MVNFIAVKADILMRFLRQMQVHREMLCRLSSCTLRFYKVNISTCPQLKLQQGKQQVTILQYFTCQTSMQFQAASTTITRAFSQSLQLLSLAMLTSSGKVHGSACARTEHFTSTHPIELTVSLLAKNTLKDLSLCLSAAT